MINFESSSIYSKYSALRGTLVVVFVLALTQLSGCATYWVVNGGKPFEEKAQQEIVPEGGVDETLNLTLFPAGLPVTPAPQTGTASTTSYVPPSRIPSLQCRLSQSGDETVHRNYRLYGSTWKKTAAVAFVTEAALAALFLLSDGAEIDQQIFGAYMAADALGTGVLAFMPQRDKFRSKKRNQSLDIHQLCPPGLSLELAGRRVAVDREGKLEDSSKEYLREHLERNLGPIVVHLDLDRRGSMVSEIDVDQGAKCGWARSTNHQDRNSFCQQPGYENTSGYGAAPTPVTASDRVTTILFVTPGTLSMPASTPAN